MQSISLCKWLLILDTGRLWSIEVIQALHNLMSLLILVIELDLLVLITNQLLHINASLAGNPQPDLALGSKLVIT